MSVTFDYIYREIPFTITTEDDTVNILLVMICLILVREVLVDLLYNLSSKAIRDVDEQDLLF